MYLRPAFYQLTHVKFDFTTRDVRILFYCGLAHLLVQGA